MPASLKTRGLNGFVRRVKKYALAHKFVSGIGVLVFLLVFWWVRTTFFAPATPTRYVLTTVQADTIIASITGSGQVSASDQVVVNPKASGEIVAVYAHDGQQVASGQALAAIDSTNAQKAVRDAKANLQSAQIALQKLQEPADQLSLTQSQNAAENAKNNLANAYADDFNAVSNTFLDMPTVMTGLNSILFSYDRALGGGTQQNVDFYTNAVNQYDTTGRAQRYHDDAVAKYNAVKTVYDATFTEYKTTSRTADAATIEALIGDSYQMMQAIADAAKSVSDLIQLYQDTYTARGLLPISTSNTQLSSLGTYTSSINTHLSALSSAINTLAVDKQNVTETEQSLAKLQAGADPLDVQSSQLSVTQKQNSLQDAQDALADYTIRAPFSGTLANFNLHAGDNVGSGTAVATEISSGDIADLSLNEVDAAKVQVGQKATLTFDAIPDLTLAGQVASVSPLGAVSQGVVSYDIKISFATQDGRVKAGMTVNASIITAMKQDALAVPSSAIKTQGSSSYVLVVDNPPTAATSTTSSSAGITLTTAPRQVVVTTGISSNTQTEILSGLTAGQTIVSRTVSGTAQTTTSSTPSLIGGGGARGGGVLRGG